MLVEFVVGFCSTKFLIPNHGPKWHRMPMNSRQGHKTPLLYNGNGLMRRYQYLICWIGLNQANNGGISIRFCCLGDEIRWKGDRLDQCLPDLCCCTVSPLSYGIRECIDGKFRCFPAYLGDSVGTWLLVDADFGSWSAVTAIITLHFECHGRATTAWGGNQNVALDIRDR